MPAFRLLVFVTFIFSLCAYASESVEANLKIDNSTIKNPSNETGLLNASELNHAKSWGISNEQYIRYKEIMRSPRAYFTPNLEKNPLLALALEAENDAERQKLAEKWVQIQYENNINIIKWQLSVSEAWKNNFPNIPRFAYKKNPNKEFAISNQVNGSNSLVDDLLSSKRAELYVKLDCSSCLIKYKELRKKLDANSIDGIDIFFINNPSHEEMIDWALKQKITMEEVSAYRKVTLNYARNEVRKVPFVQLIKG